VIYLIRKFSDIKKSWIFRKDEDIEKTLNEKDY